MVLIDGRRSYCQSICRYTKYVAPLKRAFKLEENKEMQPKKTLINEETGTHALLCIHVLCLQLRRRDATISGIIFQSICISMIRCRDRNPATILKDRKSFIFLRSRSLFLGTFWAKPRYTCVLVKIVKTCRDPIPCIIVLAHKLIRPLEYNPPVTPSPCQIITPWFFYFLRTFSNNTPWIFCFCPFFSRH